MLETLSIDSIKGFLDVLRGKPDPDFVVSKPKKIKTKVDIVYDRIVKELVSEFRREVESLDRFKPLRRRHKLFILADDFYYFWTKVYVELKEQAKERERTEDTL